MSIQKNYIILAESNRQEIYSYLNFIKITNVIGVVFSIPFIEIYLVCLTTREATLLFL